MSGGGGGQGHLRKVKVLNRLRIERIILVATEVNKNQGGVSERTVSQALKCRGKLGAGGVSMTGASG